MRHILLFCNIWEISHESISGESLVVHATAGAAAVTTPLDVVRTQLHFQAFCGCDRFNSGSIRNVIPTILKKDGYRGLMRGWTPRMLFHTPPAAICWSTYEASKALFQELNGSNEKQRTF